MKVRVTEYLEIDLTSEQWCCQRCGHALISARENYKKGCLVDERPLAEVSIFDLLAAFNEVFKRATEGPSAEILGDEVKVADKIREIRELVQHTDVVRFADLFRAGATRMELVATFLAMLELIRLKVILVFQRGPFATIELARIS